MKSLYVRYKHIAYLGPLVNFRTLDLNLLRVFDAVMSEGSLTRAAEVLAITQPAASHALKRLHEAVGEALFVRNAFGMTPTPKAEALWPQVRIGAGARCSWRWRPASSIRRPRPSTSAWP